MKSQLRRHELHPSAGRYLSFLLVIAALPFFSYLPNWIMSVFFLFVGWRLYSDRKGWNTPSKFIQIPILFAVSGYLFYSMSELNFSSLESFVAWLVVLGVFKLLETVKARDVRIVVLMVWLIAGCLQLFDQTSTHLIMGVAITLFATITLRALYDPDDKSGGFFSATGGVLKLFLLGLPIGLLIFIVFPRFSVKALGLGIDPKSGSQSGFSEDVDPGSVSELAQSEEIVMRVTFPGNQVLRMSDLYWRGSVLDHSEGLRWRKTMTPLLRPPSQQADGIEQMITLEPQHGLWLFALDHPGFAEWITEVPRSSLLMDPNGALTPSREISNRVVYRVVSQIGSLQADENPSHWIDVKNSERWPRTKKFALELKAKNKTPDEFARALLLHFQHRGFVYTLVPGTIPNDSLDFFLFQGKRGFCEHYAAVAATLFRLAGFPSRVIVGFQGGVPNEFGEFYEIRNKDAHAWMEYYSPTRGWVRVDPVQVIAPDRISRGATQFFGNSQSPFAFGIFSELISPSSWVVKRWYVLRQALEAIDFKVSRFLLDFDFSMQAQLFNLGKNSWLPLSLLSLAIFLGGFFLLRLISSRRGRPRDPMLELFQEAKRILSDLGVDTEDWQAAQSTGELIEQSLIERADEWKSWLRDWQDRRYGPELGMDWLAFRELRRKLQKLAG